MWETVWTREPSMTPDNWLATAEQFSRMVSIAAIPLVLGVGGWLIQRQLQDQSIRRDYVQLALTLLQNPDTSKVPPEIREWAVDLLNENSPTKLNIQALKSLKSGSVTLPSFSFVPSSALTPALKQTLEKLLENFKKYLVMLGFAVPSETITVAISPGTVIESGGNRGIAFWDPETHSIQVAGAFASDKVSVLRQFVHELLIPAGTPSWDYFAIESGIASYFPSSFTNHPMVGDEASDAGKLIFPPQDLRKRRRVSEIQLRQWESVQNDGSEIWGGALWQVRQLLGPERTDRLVADTWREFSFEEKAGQAYVSFVNNLLAKSASIDDGNYTPPIRAVFERLGLRL
jgi:hypothetical protein